MPRPKVVLVRKIIKANEKYKVPPRLNLPPWWVGDTTHVKLKVFDDRIVIERADGDGE